jgi:predicted SAM-dependent methyltransferase
MSFFKDACIYCGYRRADLPHIGICSKCYSKELAKMKKEKQQEQSAATTVVKLHLGCFNKKIPGFVNVDVREEVNPDVVDDVAKLTQFGTQSVDLIYACHVLEHFKESEVKDVLSRWYDVLKFGGTLRVAVPDLMAACKYLVYHGGSIERYNQVRTMLHGSQKHPYDFHYISFTFETLAHHLHSAGFKDVRTYNWWETEHAHIDDYSQSYLPSKNITYRGGNPIDFGGSKLMSLNVEATK